MKKIDKPRLHTLYVKAVKNPKRYSRVLDEIWGESNTQSYFKVISYEEAAKIFNEHFTEDRRVEFFNGARSIYLFRGCVVRAYESNARGLANGPGGGSGRGIRYGEQVAITTDSRSNLDLVSRVLGLGGLT